MSNAKKTHQSRKVRIEVAAGFKDEYQAALARDPEIEGAMKEFRRAKVETPPGRLPARMKDHRLQGKLVAFRECHLAGDILLVYQHEQDVVKLVCICSHSDLSNPTYIRRRAL